MQLWATVLALCMSWQASGSQVASVGSQIWTASRRTCAPEALITTVQVSECQKQCNMAWDRCYRNCLYNERAPPTCPKDCEKDQDGNCSASLVTDSVPPPICETPD